MIGFSMCMRPQNHMQPTFFKSFFFSPFVWVVFADSYFVDRNLKTQNRIQHWYFFIGILKRCSFTFAYTFIKFILKCIHSCGGDDVCGKRQIMRQSKKKKNKKIKERVKFLKNESQSVALSQCTPEPKTKYIETCMRSTCNAYIRTN